MLPLTAEELVRIANLRDLCRSGAARALRVSAGLSLQNVSRATGIGITTLWRWETGDRQPLATKAALDYAYLLDELANRNRPGRYHKMRRNAQAAGVDHISTLVAAELQRLTDAENGS